MQPDFWNQHYEEFKVTEPSSFARFCAEQVIHPTDVVIEIGCGNGRDGVFLASLSSRYIGIDLSKRAIDKFSERVGKKIDASKFEFFCGDVLNFDFRSIVPPSGGRILIYSRFSLHSLDERTEIHIRSEFAKIPHRKVIAIEARTIFDPWFGVGDNVARNAFVTDHFRRFIDPRDILDFVMKNASLEYFLLARGFAVTEKEDPIVMRVVASGENE